MKFTVGCYNYDRTWPLIAGVVPVEGATLDWNIVPPEVSFVEGQVNGAWHVSELSFATHLVQLARGTARYTAVPVFPSRAFRHGAVFVRADAGIERPEDLAGRAIGGPEWQLTANVWARGILADDHGVGLDTVNWFQGGLDAPGGKEKVPLSLPPHIRLSSAPDGESLWSMMAAGKLDAIIGPRPPAAFLAGDPRVRRLFADVKAAEQAYYARTKIFPIMHLIGIRNDVLAEAPDLPARLFAAFEQARQRACADLEKAAYLHAMLPWLPAHLAETKRLMGDDYWTYGIEANRTVIETLCRYAHEQGLTDRRMTAADLFPGF